MRKESLALLDACAVIVAAMIIFISWFYLPHETFTWGVILAALVLVTAAYLSLMHFVSHTIEARRKARGRPVDTPKRPWLAMLNYVGAAFIFAILFLFWFYLPREFIGWGIQFATIVLLLVCLVNWWNLVVDYVDAGKPV